MQKAKVTPLLGVNVVSGHLEGANIATRDCYSEVYCTTQKTILALTKTQEKGAEPDIRLDSQWKISIGRNEFRLTQRTSYFEVEAVPMGDETGQWISARVVLINDSGTAGAQLQVAFSPV